MAAAFCSGDALNPIVADIGQCATKIGFAGEDYPRSYFRSNVAVLREESMFKGAATLTPEKEHDQVMKETENLKISNEKEQQSALRSRQHQRGRIKDIRYDYYTRPICERSSTENGNDGKWEICNPVDPITGLWYNHETTIMASSNDSNNTSYNANDIKSSSTYGADWMDLIPTFLRHGYKTGLGTSLENHPLMLVERSYNIPPLRQQMIEILFEECNIPAVFLGRDATLACYACGRTTGTVVDIGYGRTTITPVYEGYAEQKGINICPIGTRSMDECIAQYLDHLYSTEKKKKNYNPSQKQQFLPIYQVRNYKRRLDPFHFFARLEVAQHCRENGAGAAIHLDPNSNSASAGSGNKNSTSATVSAAFSAPHLSFALPDRTVLNIPSQYRFGIAQLLLGTTYQQQQEQKQLKNNDNHANEGNSFNSNYTYQKRREQIMKENEKNFAKVLSAASNAIEEEEKNIEKAESIKASEKFSETAAVGISSRKRRMVGKDASSDPVRLKDDSHGSGDDRIKNVAFSNYHLQHACHKYLQSLYDNSYGGHSSRNTSARNGGNSDMSNPNKDDESTVASSNTSNIPQKICDTAFACDRDQQGSLLSNIIICGGGSCIGPNNNSMMDYIKYEVEQIIHVHTPGWRVKVLSPNEQERSICSWLGGSILGSLGTFHDMWITKAEYEEYGSSIVNRKCP